MTSLHESVVMKLSFRGETHRMTMSMNELTIETLNARVHDCYDDARRPKNWTLIYRDNEDDLVTVSTEEELQEACRVFIELKESMRSNHKPHFHFHVVSKVTLKDQLAPVMHVVEDITEKVARLASDTKEHVRKSSYVERSRGSLASSAVHTREALSSVGRGISTRIRRASSVASDQISDIRERVEKRRARSRVSSLDDMVLSSPVLMTTDVEREEEDESVPPGLSLQDLLEQALTQQNDEEEDEENARDEAEDEVIPIVEPLIVPEEAHEEVAHTSDAETSSTDSEGSSHSWDIVGASDSPIFAVDAQDDLEVYFGPYEHQIKMIHDVMPQVDTNVCVELLDKHQGNLEAVLIELTDL